jgi:predicted acetyltransferase
MELVSPRLAFEDSYREYIRELADEARYPFPLEFEHDDFPALLRRLDNLERGVGVPEGFVPSSTYWLIDGAHLVGVSNLRHTLNDKLRHCGGHIGLGLRPSRRGRGLGSELLALTIKKAKERGIGEIHVHCYKRNTPSARMILRNGGVLDSEIQDERRSEIIQRYRVGAA